MNANRKKYTERNNVENTGTQTRLQCYPFVIQEDEQANVLTDQSVQTIVTIEPRELNQDVYDRLTHLSHSELLREYASIIIIPKKSKPPKLQFVIPSKQTLITPVTSIIIDDLEDLESINEEEQEKDETPEEGTKSNVSVKSEYYDAQSVESNASDTQSNKSEEVVLKVSDMESKPSETDKIPENEQPPEETEKDTGGTEKDTVGIETDTVKVETDTVKVEKDIAEVEKDIVEKNNRDNEQPSKSNEPKKEKKKIKIEPSETDGPKSTEKKQKNTPIETPVESKAREEVEREETSEKLLSSQRIGSDQSTDEEKLKGVLKKMHVDENRYDPTLDPELLFPEIPGVPFVFQGIEQACQETQTELSVRPQIVDGKERATVITDMPMQTSITCIPQKSITNILPDLKRYHNHKGQVVPYDPTKAGPTNIYTVRQLIDKANDQHYKMFDFARPSANQQKQSNGYQNSDVKYKQFEKFGEMGDRSWDLDLPEIDSSTSVTGAEECNCEGICMCDMINRFMQENDKTIEKSTCDCLPTEFCENCRERKYIPPITPCLCKHPLFSNVTSNILDGTGENNKTAQTPCLCAVDRKAQCICIDKIEDKTENVCKCTIDRNAVCICKGRYRPPIITTPGECPCTLDRYADCICNICKCAANYKCKDTCIGNQIKIKCGCLPVCNCEHCSNKMFLEGKFSYDYKPTCTCVSPKEPDKECICKYPCRTCTCGSQDGRDNKGGKGDKGGRVGKGGRVDKGGSADKGGSVNKGGSVDKGGRVDKGGSVAKGGSVDKGGSVAKGGSVDKGGGVGKGGKNVKGGKDDKAGKDQPMICECTPTNKCDLCVAKDHNKNNMRDSKTITNKPIYCKCPDDCNCENCYYKEYNEKLCVCPAGSPCPSCPKVKYRKKDLFDEQKPVSVKCNCEPGCKCPNCQFEKPTLCSCPSNCDCDNSKKYREDGGEGERNEAGGAKHICQCSPTCTCEGCQGVRDAQKCKEQDGTDPGCKKVINNQVVCGCNPCKCKNCGAKQAALGDFQEKSCTKCKCIPPCTCDGCPRKPTDSCTDYCAQKPVCTCPPPCKCEGCAINFSGNPRKPPTPPPDPPNPPPDPSSPSSKPPSQSSKPPSQSSKPPSQSSEPPPQPPQRPSESSPPPNQPPQPPAQPPQPPAQSPQPPTQPPQPPTQSPQPPTQSSQPPTQSSQLWQSPTPLPKSLELPIQPSESLSPSFKSLSKSSISFEQNAKQNVEDITEIKFYNNLVLKSSSITMIPKMTPSISQNTLSEIKRKLELSGGLLLPKFERPSNDKYRCKTDLFQIDTDNTKCQCFICSALTLLHPKDCRCLLCSSKRKHHSDCNCQACILSKRTITEKVQNFDDSVNVFVDYVAEDLVFDIQNSLINNETKYKVNIKIMIDSPTVQQKTIVLPRNKETDNAINVIPRCYKNPLAGIMTQLILNDVISILKKYNFTIYEDELYDEIDIFTNSIFKSFFQRYGIKQKNKINVICSPNEMKYQNVISKIDSTHDIHIYNHDKIFENIERNVSINILKIIETYEDITIPISLKMIPINVVSTVSSLQNIILTSPSFEEAKKFVRESIAEYSRTQQEIEHVEDTFIKPKKDIIEDDHITLYKDTEFGDDDSECYLSIKSYGGEDMKLTPIPKLFKDPPINKKSDPNLSLIKLLTSIKSSESELKSDSVYFIPDEPTDLISLGSETPKNQGDIKDDSCVVQTNENQVKENVVNPVQPERLSVKFDESKNVIEFLSNIYMTESETDTPEQSIQSDEEESVEFEDIENESVNLDDFQVTSLESDEIGKELIKPDVQIESVESDGIGKESIKPDGFQIESVESDGIGKEPIKPDDLQMESVNTDEIQTESVTHRSDSENKADFESKTDRVEESIKSDITEKELIKTDEVKMESVKPDGDQIESAKADKTESVKTDEVKIKSGIPIKIKTESGKPDEIKTESVKPDEIKIEPGTPDEIRIESVKPDEIITQSVKPDEIKTESVELDEIQLELVKSDEILIESVKPEYIQIELVKLDKIQLEPKSDKSLTNISASFKSSGSNEELESDSVCFIPEKPADLLSQGSETSRNQEDDVCAVKSNDFKDGEKDDVIDLVQAERLSVKFDECINVMEFLPNLDIIEEGSIKSDEIQEESVKPDVTQVESVKPDESVRHDRSDSGNQSDFDTETDSVYYISNSISTDTETDSMHYINTDSNEGTDTETSLAKEDKSESDSMYYIDTPPRENQDTDTEQFLEEEYKKDYNEKSTQVSFSSQGSNLGSYILPEVNSEKSDIVSPFSFQTSIFNGSFSSKGLERIKESMEDTRSKDPKNDIKESSDKEIDSRPCNRVSSGQTVLPCSLKTVPSWTCCLTKPPEEIKVAMEDVEKSENVNKKIEATPSQTECNAFKQLSECYQTVPVCSLQTVNASLLAPEETKPVEDKHPEATVDEISFQNAKDYVKKSYEKYIEVTKEIEKLRLQQIDPNTKSSSKIPVRQKTDTIPDIPPESITSFEHAKTFVKKSHEKYKEIDRQIEKLQVDSYLLSDSNPSSTNKISSEYSIFQTSEISDLLKSDDFMGVHLSATSLLSLSAKSSLEKISTSAGAAKSIISSFPSTAKSYLEKIPGNLKNYFGKIPETARNYLSSPPVDSLNLETDSNYDTCEEGEVRVGNTVDTTRESEFYTSRESIRDDMKGIESEIEDETEEEPTPYTLYNPSGYKPVLGTKVVDVNLSKYKDGKFTETSPILNSYSPPVKDHGNKIKDHSKGTVRHCSCKCAANNLYNNQDKTDKNLSKVPSVSSVTKMTSFEKNYYPSKSASFTSLTKPPSVRPSIIDMMDKPINSPSRYDSYIPTSMKNQFSVRNMRNKRSKCSINKDPVLSAKLACEAELEPIKEALNTVQTKLRNLNMPELDCILCRSNNNLSYTSTNFSYLYPQPQNLTSNYFNPYYDPSYTRRYYTDSYTVPSINTPRRASSIYDPDSVMPLYKKNFSDRYNRYTYNLSDHIYPHPSRSTRTRTSRHHPNCKYSHRRYETNSMRSTEPSFYNTIDHPNRLNHEWDDVFTNRRSYNSITSIPSIYYDSGSISTSETSSEEETVKHTKPHKHTSRTSSENEELCSKHTSDSSTSNYQPFLEVMKNIVAKEKNRRNNCSAWYNISGISGFENMSVKVKVKPPKTSKKRKT